MSSFGDRLREEREQRGRTLEELAAATGIGLPYLEALEGNQFQALPGRAFGKLYIRAYAEVLGFDPGPRIADYEREVQRWEQEVPPEARQPRPIMVPPTLAAPTPAEAPNRAAAGDPDRSSATPGGGAPEPAARRRLPSGRVLAGAAALVVCAVAFLGVRSAFFRRATPERDISSPEAAAQESAAPELPAEPAVEPQAPATRSPTPRPLADSAPPSAGRLTVPDYGVGRQVVGHRLEGRGDRFEEGAVVSFWTRVQGGRKGERIRHVWTREGRSVGSVELVLGGPHWRTYSTKTLWGTGSWRVEVQDEQRHVLAATEFTCVPKS